MKLFNKNSFLFPTLHELFLAIFLFFIFGWFVWPAIVTSIITDWYPVGFPFTINAVGLCEDCYSFSWSALFLNGIFWYLISTAIVQSHLRLFTIVTLFVLAVLGIWVIGNLLL